MWRACPPCLWPGYEERGAPAMQGTTPALIIVNGLPATGKTTLSIQLADALGLALFSKDMFKEILFDTLGWSDRAWSRRLGVASIALLVRVAEAELRAR